MADRRRLLLITRNFPPLLGGMERLNWNLAREMTRFAEVAVVVPKGAAAHAPEGVRVIETAGPALKPFLAGVWWRAVRVARQYRPDVVLAGSGLTAPMAWWAARVSGARAAVYLHGLDAAVDHSLYRLLWHPILRRVDGLIVNSTATRELSENLGIAPGRISIIPPGVALPQPISEAERQRIRKVFRQEHGLGEGPLLLSVGRLTTRKGMLEFVRDVLPAVVAQAPDVQLAIIGGIPSKALAARAQTPEQILGVAEQAGLADRLHFLGEITDWGELQAAYLAADVHVFPVRNIPGDPEGFGMVAVEAAAHGLPTVAYAVGGVVDAVADGISGYLVTTGDAADFAKRTIALLNEPLPAGAVRAFAERFAWTLFGSRLAVALGLRPAHLPT